MPPGLKKLMKKKQIIRGVWAVVCVMVILSMIATTVAMGF